MLALLSQKPAVFKQVGLMLKGDFYLCLMKPKQPPSV